MSGRPEWGYDRLYSLQEIGEMAALQTGEIKLTLEDAILLLLYADPRPIEGKTRLMKEVFLALRETLSRADVERVDFRPHRFGPYTERVYGAADQLAFANKVQVARDKNRGGYSLAITPKGRAHIGARFSALPARTREDLARKRAEWDTLTPAGIRDYVYIHYPECLENALLKGRFEQAGTEKEGKAQ